MNVFFHSVFFHWIWFWSQKWSKMINKKVASLVWICLFIKLVINDLFWACFYIYMLQYSYEIVVRLIFCNFWAFDFFRPNSSKLVQTRLLLNQKWKKLIWVFFLLNFCHWFQFWVLKKPKMINKAVSFSLCTWRKIFFCQTFIFH